MADSSPDNARRNDRITAVVLFLLGAAMLVGGFSMDRLEVRRIHPASIPGLVPMLLGAILAACAAILYRRAGAGAAPSEAARHGTDGEGEGEGEGAHSVRRLAVAAVWSVIYALGLVGTLPFAVATAIYVGAFVALFGWHATEDPRSRVALIAKAVALAVPFAWGVSALFSDVFLVRLP